MKFKKYIMTLMCAFSVLLSSFVFGFESNAAGDVNSYYFNNFSVTSEPIRVIGKNDDFDYSGDGQYLYPYGVMTARIPFSLYIPNGLKAVTMTKDYVHLTFESPEVVVNYIDAPSASYVDVLSANIVCENQTQPIMLSDSTQGCMFDLSSYNDGSYPVQDVFYIDITFYYELYGSASATGEHIFYPPLEFSLTFKNDLMLVEGSGNTYLYDIYKELQSANVTNKDIYNKLNDIHNDMINDSDSTQVDDFQDKSDSQSSALDSLNEQNKMDKIDVDSASSSVDANIDGNAISNYGVVLSSITGQGKVVQLMLIVLSVGLVAYVLFGKR